MSLQEKQVGNKLKQLMQQVFFKDGFIKSTKVQLQFAGFGLTLIDNQPKEILYISLKELKVDLQQNEYSNKLSEGKLEKTEIELTIGDFQIDNMVNDQLPVVFGAKDFYQNTVKLENGEVNEYLGDISSFYKTVKTTDMAKNSYTEAKRRAQIKELEDDQRLTPFIKI